MVRFTTELLEGKRQKAEGRRQKAKGKRQKAKGRRQKAEGKSSLDRKTLNEGCLKVSVIGGVVEIDQYNYVLSIGG